MRGDALFSGCGSYRYLLVRSFDTADLFDRRRGSGTCCFCMLNPSTADAENDDPTIRRCIGFARSWGFARLTIVNLYAYRATDPKEMRRAEKRGLDIIGADNDTAIGRASGEAQIVVAAWGNEGELGRAWHVIKLIGKSKLRCLGVSKIGAPWHPLYLPSDLEPQRWSGQ